MLSALVTTRLGTGVTNGDSQNYREVAGLLDGLQRAEHPDYEPNPNFKKAKAEAAVEQQGLL